MSRFGGACLPKLLNLFCRAGGKNNARASGMSRLALVGLLVLSACVLTQRNIHRECRGECAAVSAVQTAIDIAVEATAEPSGPFCDPEFPDPQHTCPVKAPEAR